MKSATNALRTLGSTDQGNTMINELQNSENNFSLVSGSDRFDPGEVGQTMIYRNNAESNRVNETGENVIKDMNFIPGKIGSGGIIYWDPNSTPPSISGKRTLNTNSTIALGHEIGHAFDANRGLLDTRIEIFNGVAGEQRSEIRATYYQNLISQQLGSPLRTQYSNGGAQLVEDGVPLNFKINGK